MRVFSIIFLFLSLSLSAQKGDIRGNVYDKATGEPIAFATVFLAGTSYGTTTNSLGFYTIASVPKGDYRLVVNYIGYDSASFLLTLQGNQIIAVDQL